MEEAQEKDMDSIACLKRGALIPITGQQYNVCSKNLKTNLLVSSSRYGYVFYATETDGLAILSSTYIDRESKKFIMSVDDDNDENVQGDTNSIIYRSYLPGQSVKQNLSLIPHWLSLNADETILAIILIQTDMQASVIIFYDVVQLIQKPTSSPICPAIRLTKDMIGNSIRNFIWNPVIPNVFAYIDELGSVSTFSIDKQLNRLGKSASDANNSSICWSPKGKNIVVVKYDGSLELCEQNVQSKKKYPSVMTNQPSPPCINVLWITTHQFLLGFSATNSNSDSNAFVHVMATYNKDQPPKAQIFYDLFFDMSDAPNNTNLQYFYGSLNQNKIIILGLSKSMKISVIGSDELSPDSYDTWTFPDHLRADVKGASKVDNKQLTLTGMALGLNSTVPVTEYKKKLPSCPMLLLSNNEGVLLVYYLIHQDLSSICRAPEVIKQIQVGDILGTSTATPIPTPSLSTFFSSQSSTNGLSMTQLSSIATPATTTISSQPNEKINLTNAFNFTQQPVQTTNGLPLTNLSKTMTTNVGSKSTPTQQLPTKSAMNNEQPSTQVADNKKLLQMVDQFQSKLNSLTKSLEKPSTMANGFDNSLGNLTTNLQNMTTSLQKSAQSIRTMTSEHIEYMTKIEDARYQLRSSQKENLHHSLKDRALDPWTQARLDSIKTKYDQLKHDLNVLLQVAHATIHDKSLQDASDDAENEDFIPDLEISLNSSRTMKQGLQNRIKELGRKVSKTEIDLEAICSKFNTDILSSKTFNKTTMSSERPFHNSDAELLAHLQATHKKITQVRVPSAVGINLSSTIDLSKKQSTNELSKPTTPLIQSSILQQPTSPSADSEGFKNMLRLVRTSIDLFSGATSPEQLRELSNTITTSPLSASQKSNNTSMPKTPTMTKTTNLMKTATMAKTPQTTTILQTPAKSTSSPVPTISVTPATPATQSLPTNAPLSLAQTRPFIPTTTDQTKSQTISTTGDSAIRSLLNNTVSPVTNTTSATAPLASTVTPNQVAPSSSFGNPLTVNQAASVPSTSTVSTPSPFPVSSSSATTTTSIQSTSPTTKPVTPTGFSAFGSKPTLSGSSPLNLGSLSFGSSSTAPAASTGSPFSSVSTATTSAASPFSGGLNTTSSTTPSSTTGLFGSTTTTAPSPFGVTPTTSTASPFGATPTTSAPSPFGGATPTTSAAGTSIFGTTTSAAAPTTGMFGSTTATAPSPFGATPTTSAAGTSIFGTATTTAASATGIFGSTTATAPSPFGATPATSAAGTSIFGAPPSTVTPSTGIFGSTTTTKTSIFGAALATSSAGTSIFGGGSSGFGSSTSTSSPLGGTFTSAPSTSVASPFSGGSTTPSSAPSGSVFGGFGSNPSLSQTSTSTTGGFGMSSSTATSPSSGATFGASPVFGSTFSGFGTQPKPSGSTTGFSFGGFTGQTSSSAAPPQSFGSFGSAATSPPQMSSQFGGGGGGGPLFGGASPTQSAGFGATGSPFGVSPTQSSTSSPFTTYRK